MRACYGDHVTNLLDHLEFGEQLLSALQHGTRDRVELVVDLGYDWNTLEPSLNALVKDGYVVVHESDGEDVFELARSVASPPAAETATQ